jgi:hypothetical protein
LRFEVKRQEHAVDMLDLALVDSICHLFVESLSRADDSHFGIGVEEVYDATGGNLDKSDPYS